MTGKPLTVVYSFGKHGQEADIWQREIAAASSARARFVPFNHDPYLDWREYRRAQLLDDLYYDRDARLAVMYRDLERVCNENCADAIVVDNFSPYHPDYLRKLPVYKILRTTDGPVTAYDRDIPYLHAYDHVLYHSPAYSRDMDMAEKLHYAGARRADFWPLALFDSAFDANKTEDELFAVARDVELIFIGGLHIGKLSLLASVKRAFGRRFRLHGLTTFKTNAYLILRYGFPGWVTPIRFDQYVPLYQRSQIGLNIHNRGMYTVGNYRLFELAGNAVMQITDGGDYLRQFFDVGTELVTYDSDTDLIEKIRHYLTHVGEREAIARRSYRRVMQQHRFGYRMRQLAALIENGMSSVAVPARTADAD